MSLPSQKHVFITCKKNVCRNERSYKIFVYKYLGKPFLKQDQMSTDAVEGKTHRT